MLVLLVPSQVFISFDIQSACDFPCGNVSIHFGLKIKLFCDQQRPRISTVYNPYMLIFVDVDFLI